MNTKQLINLMKSLGLHPSTKRSLPLFTLSTLGHAYTQELKKSMGFTYQGLGAIGGNNSFHSLINDDKVAEKVKYFLKNNPSQEKLFNQAQQLFIHSKQELTEATKYIPTQPEKFLRIIPLKYKDYITSIGIYNCFWRYIGDNASQKGISPERIQKISQERDQVASFYPTVEEWIKTGIEEVGKKEGFEGDLLRYLTFKEMEEYIKNKNISPQKFLELSQRRERYFYLLIEDGKEIVSTNSELIKEIEENFFKINKEVEIIIGNTAHPGKVIGRVFSLENSNPNNVYEDCILVASMTHPNHTSLIGKSKAIITDEGGILCHAAIIAREMNIPCIVGTKFATKILKEGDVVEVDATNGTVKILK